MFYVLEMNQNTINLIEETNKKIIETENKIREINNNYDQEFINQNKKFIETNIKNIHDSLIKLKVDTDILKQTDEHIILIKIQENQHAHLSRKYLNTINQYREACDNITKQKFEEIKRHVKIKYTNEKGISISDEELNRLTKNIILNEKNDSIFQQSKDTLTEILETRSDILRIERSLQDLNCMFNDIAALITEQGEILDNIADNVNTASNKVQHGNQTIRETRIYTKKSCKRYCWCIALILILLVLSIVLAFVLPKK